MSGRPPDRAATSTSAYNPRHRPIQGTSTEHGKVRGSHREARRREVDGRGPRPGGPGGGGEVRRREHPRGRLPTRQEQRLFRRHPGGPPEGPHPHHRSGEGPQLQAEHCRAAGDDGPWAPGDPGLCAPLLHLGARPADHAGAAAAFRLLLPRRRQDLGARGLRLLPHRHASQPRRTDPLRRHLLVDRRLARLPQEPREVCRVRRGRGPGAADPDDLGHHRAAPRVLPGRADRAIPVGPGAQAAHLGGCRIGGSGGPRQPQLALRALDSGAPPVRRSVISGGSAPSRQAAADGVPGSGG